VLQPRAQDIDEVAALLRNAKQPVIVAETSGKEPAAFQALVDLADLLAVPVVNGRANAYANFPTDHPLYLGMGNYKAVENADVVLLVGGRAPWYPAQRRPTSGKIIAINDNPLKGHMIYQNLHIDFYLEGDMAEALRLLTAALKESKIDASATSARRERWSREHESYVAGLRSERERARNGGAIAPVTLMGALAEAMPSDTIYVDETITHSPLLRQHLPQTTAQSFFRGSGGLGQGIGTALGIKLAARERPIALLVGDGSFLYNPIIQALGASKQHELPVIIIVLNNKKYEAMRKGHVHHYPDGASVSKELHYGVTIDGPDYERLGEHFGFHGQKVEKLADLNGALTNALAATRDGNTSILNVVLTQ
jgi:acetolactate synthase-1/2/3 large subunit